MNTKTKVFLKKKVKEYYWNRQIKAPTEIHRREFGVGTLEDKIKFRHKSFNTSKELNQYLRTEAPYYISYSSAYYEFPSQQMDKKNWLGADLIFDLDKPMELINREKQEEVKLEAESLIVFLKDDFGFQDNEIEINFSGQKGYHIHVKSEEVKRLNSDARREIIDYISGTGVDINYFIKEVEGQKGISFRRGKMKATVGSRIGPKADSRGWAKRIYDVTEELINSPIEELERIDGVGEKTAAKLEANRKQNLKLLHEGKWDLLWDQFKGSIKKQIYSKAVTIKDDDKQVTADTSRLIRVPDTIHGGSGLVAKRVKDLIGFNPLVDTVAFKDEPVKLRLTDDVGVFHLMDKKYGPYKTGDVVTLEEYAAVYLMLKYRADVV